MIVNKNIGVEEVKDSRALTFIVILLLSILLFTACSNNGNEGASNDEDTVTLTMWNRYPELNGPFEEYINKFENEHPNIKIDLQNIPLATNTEQYQTAVMEDSLPDIFTTAVDLQELVEVEMAKNLDEIFTEDVKAEFFPGTFGEGTTSIDGSIYVYPLFSPNHGVYMMYYNKDVLEEYGISEDEIPSTWDEFVEVGKKIYEESDNSVYGLTLGNENWNIAGIVHTMATAISPNTPWIMDYKEGLPSYATDGNIETSEYLKLLLDENIMDPASLEQDTTSGEASFAAGKAAFWFGGNWVGTNLISQNDFSNFGVAPLPTKDGKPHYYPAGREANGLQVNANTEHWEEVKTFLEYGLDHMYGDVIFQPGTTQPAKMNVEGEVPFPQFETIMELMAEGAQAVPRPEQRDLEIIEFNKDLTAALGVDDIGDMVVGYLTGGVTDIEAELQDLEERAIVSFNDLLNKYSNIEKEYFEYPNWEPFTPYELEDYEELE